MRKNMLKRLFPIRKKGVLSLSLVTCLIALFPIVGFAQTTVKFSLKKDQVSLESVIRELEQKSNYTFFYNDNSVKREQLVSVNVADAPIESILKQLTESSGYTYKIEGNQIIVSSAVSSRQTNQQKQKKITGVVKDAVGEPIVGASVVEKGVPSNGTISDLNGRFTLTVAPNKQLLVSYIGFMSQTIALNPNVSSYDIALKEDTKTLDEVVVVGYGTQKRESLTGSLQTLKADKLTDIASPSVSNLLNGKAPGVYVAPGSSQPGSEGAIIIRGKSTVNGSNAPLWVVDGVIVGSSPGTLNPADIETMSILKDAASTAIYGSQGANGVIVVTTKRAKADKLTLNASVKMGLSKLNNGNLQVMNGPELYDYYKSFSNASTISFPRWNEKLREADFNWWDVATQTGFTQDYNVSLNGGNEKLRSFLSLGVYDETGAVKGYDYTRYNVRMKVDYKPFEWITIKPSFSGSKTDVTDKQYSTTAMYSNLPWDNPYDKEGNLVPNYSSTWVNSKNTNYLYNLQWNRSGSDNYHFMGSMDFDINITDWLSFSSINNLIWYGWNSNSYEDSRSASGEGVNGRVSKDHSNAERRYTNQLVRFNKLFGKHSLNMLAAYEFNDYSYKSTETAGTGIVPGFEVLDVTTKPEKTKGKHSEWAVKSYLFNANYAYDNKYLAQLSLRRDGASNFGDNAKYGNFFSVSGGWNIHKEKWFTPTWINELKLRASYGSVGNRPGDLYPQYSLYAISTAASYNGIPGALISQIGNPDLTWEKTYTTGVGLDATLFNRIRLGLDLYNKNTSNLLYKVPVTGIVGVTSIWKNVGELRNRGFEVTLGADLIQTRDLLWSIDINVSHNKNEIKELYSTDGKAKDQIIVSDGLGIAGSADKLLKPGYDSDSFFLREWAGVNPENGAPQWYKTVKAADGSTTREVTSKYAEADEVVCGNSSPTLFGGFSTYLNYKHFDLTANFGYSLGGKIYNYSRTEYDSDGAYTDRNQMRLKKGWSRWTKPNDIATHPVATYNNKSNSNKVSSRYIEDADYLRLRTVTLGYTISLPQYYIQNMRIFFTGENLFCITGYSGVDPEIPASNSKAIGSVGPSVYPAARKFMFGVNLTF